jgi:hypothetical protein
VVAAAIREVFVDDLPGMEAGDYEEHGEMYLRRGRDDGSMHVLRVDCLQRATLEEWADQDYGRELGSPRSLEQISQGDALNLCLLFARGDIAADVTDLALRTKASVRAAHCDVTDGNPDAFFAALGTAPGTVVMVAGLLGDQAVSAADDGAAELVMDSNNSGPARYCRRPLLRRVRVGIPCTRATVGGRAHGTRPGLDRRGRCGPPRAYAAFLGVEREGGDYRVVPVTSERGRPRRGRRSGYQSVSSGEWRWRDVYRTRQYHHLFDLRSG